MGVVDRGGIALPAVTSAAVEAAAVKTAGVHTAAMEPAAEARPSTGGETPRDAAMTEAAERAGMQTSMRGGETMGGGRWGSAAGVRPGDAAMFGTAGRAGWAR
jgi:hypothetical protein